MAFAPGCFLWPSFEGSFPWSQQTASFKVPAKPSYGKFGKDTLIARFLKFCKVATKGNSPQKKATKNTLAQMPSPPNYNALKVPS